VAIAAAGCRRAYVVCAPVFGPTVFGFDIAVTLTGLARFQRVSLSAANALRDGLSVAGEGCVTAVVRAIVGSNDNRVLNADSRHGVHRDGTHQPHSATFDSTVFLQALDEVRQVGQCV